MRRLIVLATALLCLLVPTATVATAAAAYNPLADPCAGAKAGAACGQSGKDPISGSGGILMKASLVIATLAGVAAVIIILVSGFNYITSNGDASKAASARQAIVGAAVGLVIIMTAEGIIIFVIKNL